MANISLKSNDSGEEMSNITLPATCARCASKIRREAALKFRRELAIAIISVFISAALCAFYSPTWAQSPPANLPKGQEVINFLNLSIDWHRQIALEAEVAAGPADQLYVADDRQAATEVLRLCFDFARANAQLLASQGGQETQKEVSSDNRYQELSRTAQDADNEVKQTQAELDGDKIKLQTARGRERRRQQAEIDELQSELDLAQTRSKSLHSILQFVSGASGSGGNLLTQIDQLERTVPELQAENTKGTLQSNPSARNTTSSQPEPSHRETPSGILALVEDLFTISHRIHIIDQRTAATNELFQTSQRLRAPLLAGLTALAQRGEELAKQADVSGATQLVQLKHELDALTTNFKQLSAVTLPLSKQEVLLDLYKTNLAEWRDAVKSEYREDLRRLLVRIAIFAIVLIAVIVLSNIWQRAVFRYIHDPRRRYQFLLLRRIILWCAIAITIAFALATEIGSIATFAGLITAGIAVALQNVIMAVAGYFFLIGKYGVRVGDRVQISGVTGDVIDIGLIRLHLMEVGGTETDRQPTGRVVVFSNAVVFQPTASFFKQIPGTSFLWHEVSLTLAPDSDYALAEKRILGAVEKVFADYHDRIEQQYREMERTLNIVTKVPKPRSRLRLTQSGLEVVIRFPVELESATEIDDRITREVLRALEQPPRLRLVGSGTPNIQPVSEEPKAA